MGAITLRDLEYVLPQHSTRAATYSIAFGLLLITIISLVLSREDGWDSEFRPLKTIYRISTRDHAHGCYVVLRRRSDLTMYEYTQYLKLESTLNLPDAERPVERPCSKPMP